MKELEGNLPHEDKTEQQIRFPKTDKQVAKQAKPHLGMTLFAIDRKTKKCEKVRYETTSMPFKQTIGAPLPGRKVTAGLSKKAQLTLEQTQFNHKVTAKADVWYVWAINKKNAMKKFEKAFPD